MPYFGLFSFLLCVWIEQIEQQEEFQCPTSGFSLFYNKGGDKGGILWCFNALLRAFLFSTLWLYNPWFCWLCKSIFACNYLTIWFSTIFLILFPPVHILATFCSALFVSSDIFILTWYLPFCNSELCHTEISVLKHVFCRITKIVFCKALRGHQFWTQNLLPRTEITSYSRLQFYYPFVSVCCFSSY